MQKKTIEKHKIRIPKKILYVTLLIIFSSSAVALVADIETLYLVKAYVLLLILQGGFFLIYRSFYALPRRRSVIISSKIQ